MSDKEVAGGWISMDSRVMQLDGLHCSKQHEPADANLSPFLMCSFFSTNK